MYKLYSLFKEKIDQLPNKAEILAQFELQETTTVPIAELLSKKYDVIEFDSKRYTDFTSYIKAVDWQTNLMATADSLIFQNKKYKPYNILTETLLRILKKNINRVNSQMPIIIIGDANFVISVATKLAFSGFVEIIVSLTDADDKVIKDLEHKIKSFIFDLNLKIISINELTSANQAGFLLISNFKREQNKDAYDLLAYFNFLSEGAMFIDCNSINDSYLVEDARKADIFVIDEVEILTNKYLRMHLTPVN